jgi:hypothetical protein
MKLRWLAHGAHFNKRDLQYWDYLYKRWVTVPTVTQQTKEDLALEASLAAIAEGYNE